MGSRPQSGSRAAGARHAIHVPYSGALRRRSAFAITETELKLIAVLAIIGLSKSPKAG